MSSYHIIVYLPTLPEKHIQHVCVDIWKLHGTIAEMKKSVSFNDVARVTVYARVNAM